MSSTETYKFRVWYEWLGPSHTDPFATKKSPAEVIDALQSIASDVKHRCSDPDVDAVATNVGTSASEIVLTITTITPEGEVMQAMTDSLRSFRLLGERLK